MQFNSYVFIMAFMPVMIAGYFVLNRCSTFAGKILIILGSIYFYAYTDVTAFAILGVSLALNYLFAKLIERMPWKKVYMVIPVAINVGLLLIFKYTDFAITNINTLFGENIAMTNLMLPLGISFFSFQQIAFVVAVFRKEISRVDLVDYLAYILYFPKLLMGPLMDPVDFIKQFNDPEQKRINWDNLSCGIKTFSYGLVKKMVLADTFAKAVTWGFANTQAASSMDWLLIMLCYTFEIYFDFSGYSDMAIGASLMLNISLPMNFDSPYKALSIRDFWKRWHISLTKFFTKYIYIPLGGSKKGAMFTYLNTMVVFLISGFWHGANWTFVLWGVLHGVLSVIERIVEKPQKKLWAPARWAVTFAILNILWLLFSADNIQQWAGILKAICCFSNMSVSDGLLEVFVIPEISAIYFTVPYLEYIINSRIRGFCMLLFVLTGSAICLIPENNYRNLKKLSFASVIFAAFAMMWGITCLGGESVFVYNSF